jgi:hypothetical protein
MMSGLVNTRKSSGRLFASASDALKNGLRREGGEKFEQEYDSILFVIPALRLGLQFLPFCPIR